MSPTQGEPKNKSNASPTFGILVEKDAEVRADLGDGFEKPRMREQGMLAPPGKLGMARQELAERVTRGTRDKQRTQVNERRDWN